MTLPNEWHLFNLATSPFFPDVLKAGPDARMPIRLFVGREDDARRLVRSVGNSPASTRQTVHGPPGIGKTTLVEYVKNRLAEERYISHPDPVIVTGADTADKLCLRILSYVHRAVLSNGDFTTPDSAPAMDTVRQLVRAFKVRGGGLGVSVPLVGGANLALSKTYVNPSTAQPSDLAPALLRDLARVAREHIGAEGVVVHLNNLENLSAADAETAANVMRDVRDTCFMAEGYHWLVVGTTEAVRRVITEVRQVRSVFTVSRPIAPLSLEDFGRLLERRYEYLALDKARPVHPPVEREALDAVYTLFQGDLRGTLRALDQAANELIGYGSTGAAQPMTEADIRAVLRRVYLDEMMSTLDGAEFEQLRVLARRGRAATFTQRDVAEERGTGTSAVSPVFGALQEYGYLAEVDRRPSGPQGGRPQLEYALTGAAWLVFEGADELLRDPPATLRRGKRTSAPRG